MRAEATVAEAARKDPPAARFAKDHLRAFVERIERLEEEIKSMNDDKRDVYAEAKANGFDVKALKKVVRIRAQDPDQRKEEEAVLETYLHALGMLDDGTGVATRAGAREEPSPDERMADAAARSRAASSQGLKATADLSQAAADAGLISQEAAKETAQLAEAVDRKFNRAPARAAPVHIPKKFREAVREPGMALGPTSGTDARPASSLVNPRHVMSDKAVKAAADRAEKRAGGET
jgi:uncharacterized protein (UPF0335 family)